MIGENGGGGKAPVTAVPKREGRLGDAAVKEVKRDSPSRLVHCCRTMPFQAVVK